MNEEDKLKCDYAMDEIEAAIAIVKEPCTRKVYLECKKWYKQHKESLEALGYKKKIPRFVGHNPKDETDDDQMAG